jgi:acetyl esterase/lipase
MDATYSDLRYRDAPSRGVAPLADVYMPSHPSGASVVLVHGGGFVFGSRLMRPIRFLGAQLAAEGIAVCAVDYRLLFRGGWVSDAVTDVRDALAFWRRHAPERGLDTQRISIVGLSAGATLAFAAAASPEARVASVVGCFGLYESRLLVGSRLREQPPVPALLLHGDADRLIPVEQAHRLATRRRAAGLPTDLVIYPGARHGFFWSPSETRDAAVRAIRDHVRACYRRDP